MSSSSIPDPYLPPSPPIRIKSSASIVYREGEVCISILHPPGDDEMSGELAAERWMPTQTVASIMLSVISMLNDPNLSSPANVEASVMYRDRRSEFNERCAGLVSMAKRNVPSHIKIPHPESDEQERKRAMMKHSTMDADDFAVDDAPEDSYGMDGSDADGSDVEDAAVDEPSEESKPPRKTKKTGREATEPAKKKPSKSSSPAKTDEVAKKAKKNPKREVLEEEDDNTETESSSSAMDTKELENLLQPDPEFKQWKRIWQNLTIWKATSKGWVSTKPSRAGVKGSALPGDLSVLTYNVLRHSTAEGSHRAAEQLKLLRDANATVLVLNDVTPAFQQQLGEQANFLGYFSVFAHHVDVPASSSPDTLVKGANTMVISKQPIIQAQMLALPSRTERNLIRVECEGSGGSSLVVVAAHLDDSPRDVKLRVQQIAQLNKATEGFTNTPHLEVYAGDFGLSAGTKEYKVISNALTDVWNVLHPGDLGLTYDPDTNKMIKVLSSTAQPCRRDRILFKSDTLTISPCEAQILGNVKISNTKYKGAYVWPSDHYALLASFSGLSDSSSSSSSKKSSRCVIS